jgi:CubicO group peptidase (beta-lactamase class C family)
MESLRRIFVFLSLECLLAPAFALAQTPNSDAAATAKVDTAVEKIIGFAKVPGMSVAVARDGTTIYAHAYGYANVAAKTPATVETHYEIGSITKQFTATAVLQLKEAGKLSLSDTLARWIPEYKRAAQVTIRQLLQQTTGIPNYTDVDGFEKIASQKPASFAAILALIDKKPLEFQPGSRFTYSNTNYILLGEIVERASATSWESYIRERIFTPAQMTHSGFIDDEPKLEPMATGYVVEKNVVKVAPKFGSGWAWSAGAIVSTVGDMLAWDAALFGGRLINQTDLASMFAGGKEAFGAGSTYGFGWVVDSADGHKRYWHNGGTFGFLSANLVFPKDRVAVVVLQNADTIATPESTAQRIFEAFQPSAIVAAAGEEPTVTARIRDWLNRFESGNIDRSQLDAGMNKLVTPQLIEQVKLQLGPLGAPQSLVFLGKTKAAGSTVYRYRADFSAMSFTILMEVDGSGKISGFRLLP